MTNAFQTVSQLLILAVLTTVAIVGCGDSGNLPDGESNTEIVVPSQPNSSAELASSSEPVSAPDTPLMDAAVGGDVDAVQRHIAAGTDLNQRNPASGSTALIAAVSLGQNETATTLIEGGADLELKNNEGSTALHSAAFLCREEIVRALLAKGADRNARNNTGSTALDSVAGPFDDVKPIYDVVQAVLGPMGLKLDYERIKTTRPKIAEILRR